MYLVLHALTCCARNIPHVFSTSQNRSSNALIIITTIITITIFLANNQLVLWLLCRNTYYGGPQ